MATSNWIKCNKVEEEEKEEGERDSWLSGFLIMLLINFSFKKTFFFFYNFNSFFTSQVLFVKAFEMMAISLIVLRFMASS